MEGFKQYYLDKFGQQQFDVEIQVGAQMKSRKN